jgi:hypothetical protein
MKKTTLVLALTAFAHLTFAQSQRIVLAEEFTQASCGPCASQNPAFNALLSANSSKIVAIKYQTSWPGVDPMNAQNPGQVQTRVTYYNVTGVPHALIDGVSPTGASYVGAPANFSQAKLDAAYAVSSPFTINLTHTMSADYDSIFITADITATEAVNVTGPLKGHIAIVEKEINFKTPPGTNGEKVFHSVMRRMLPSDQGTTLPTAWTVGQTETITISAAVPTYIYDISQISVVAFVQDNANKSVKQAAYSAPKPVAVDAGITAISSIPFMQCVTDFTPAVTIQNYGTSTLTSATINYRIDNGTVSTLPWSGSLAQGASEQVNLPVQSTTVGQHTFSAYTTDPNGQTDFNTKNNTSSSLHYILNASGTGTSVNEGFVSPSFPPTGWLLYNADGGVTWTRVTTTGGFGLSANAVRMNFNGSPAGEIEDLILPAFDFSNSAGSPISMTFDMAYCQASANNRDSLFVLVSTDCGDTWTKVFQKGGSALATAPINSTTFFTPTSTQWRQETIDLTTFGGESNVLVTLRARSNGYGNNGFVDNVNVRSIVGINERSTTSGMQIFPNPFSNSTSIIVNSDRNQNLKFTIYNVLGERVFTLNKEINQGTNKIEWNGASNSGEQLPAGVYYCELSDGRASMDLKKIIITR